jgi:exosome complex component RRP45
VIITRLLEKSIRRTEAVDREALCIIAGQKVRWALYMIADVAKVWQIRLSLHFLSDEGNMLDCASLAAMTALRHFRRPDVEVIGDEVIVVRSGS